jgi:hypothetical protein
MVAARSTFPQWEAPIRCKDGSVFEVHLLADQALAFEHESG